MKGLIQLLIVTFLNENEILHTIYTLNNYDEKIYIQFQQLVFIINISIHIWKAQR
jgi:hypothetical protein